MAILQSAGILPYRIRNNVLEVFLVHPGGPFYAKKDLGVWSIVKGEFADETPLEAAKREFKEETTFEIDGEFFDLGTVTQKSGKQVYAFALEADFDASKMKSNTFEMEWPPKSGKKQEFPEDDRGEWFSIFIAKEKINEAQGEFLLRLATMLQNNGVSFESGGGAADQLSLL